MTDTEIQAKLRYLRRDNSNIYETHPHLANELKKDRFKKIQLGAYINYRLTVGEAEYPFNDFDFQLDLEKFLSKLPRMYQEIFTLSFIEGYTQVEIAEELNYTQGRISQILIELKKDFKEYYYRDEDETDGEMKETESD